MHVCEEYITIKKVKAHTNLLYIHLVYTYAHTRVHSHIPLKNEHVERVVKIHAYTNTQPFTQKHTHIHKEVHSAFLC